MLRGRADEVMERSRADIRYRQQPDKYCVRCSVAALGKLTDLCRPDLRRPAPLRHRVSAALRNRPGHGIRRRAASMARE